MRVLSGIQPTGGMHIGNYLGAVKYWLELQERHDCLFMLADLHALTVPQNPSELRASTMEKARELLAVGIDPERCVVFAQSTVAEHAELAWLLTTMTSMGELERMTQFKDKAKKQSGPVSAGLFAYPALMAADILLYQTEGVPVGEDQRQHLELTRQLARRFNSAYGDTFTVPDALVPKEGGRVMSLKNPRVKMSKSDEPSSFVGLFDEPETIRKKIGAAVTDTKKNVAYAPGKQPGVSNLLEIFALVSQTSPGEAERRFSGKGYKQLKEELSDLLVETLAPFRERRRELQKRDSYVLGVLRRGAKQASRSAAPTLGTAKEKMGLLGL